LGIAFSFVPTNYFTYVTNKKWVFVSGKHDAKKEFMLFTLAAAMSFVVCQLGAYWLIQDGRLNDFLVSLSVIVISTFVNFVFRKCVVFAA
jgi:putative flippase GtrA